MAWRARRFPRSARRNSDEPAGGLASSAFREDARRRRNLSGPVRRTEASACARAQSIYRPFTYNGDTIHVCTCATRQYTYMITSSSTMGAFCGSRSARERRSKSIFATMTRPRVIVARQQHPTTITSPTGNTHIVHPRPSPHPAPRRPPIIRSLLDVQYHRSILLYRD